MTRMKALLAGSVIAAVTALSFAAVSAAPGQAPSGDEAAAARPGYHHVHKVRGEGHGAILPGANARILGADTRVMQEFFCYCGSRSAR